jgi:hypothetical protein
MTPERQAQLEDYRTTKLALQDRVKAATAGVSEIVRLARPLRLPTFPAAVGEILRELDRRGLLDGTLLVVGINCIPVYSLEAAARLPMHQRKPRTSTLRGQRNSKPRMQPFGTHSPAFRDCAYYYTARGIVAVRRRRGPYDRFPVTMAICSRSRASYWRCRR